MKTATYRSRFVILACLLICASVATVASYATSARMRRQEQAAKSAVERLGQVEALFHASGGKYAVSLEELVDFANQAPDQTAAGLLGGSLATGRLGGYHFTVKGTPEGYLITAIPNSIGSSGSIKFYSDETQMIRESRSR